MTIPTLKNQIMGIVKTHKAIRSQRIDGVISYLENWAKQGVLLLNTSLTVEAGKPASHADKGWEQLTGPSVRWKGPPQLLTQSIDAVISTISEKKAHVVFMLWGAHAQRRASKINKSVSSFLFYP